MTRSSRGFAAVEAVTAAVTVVVGWAVFVDQVRFDGWITGGGTAVLLAAAVAATAGAVTAVVARRRDRHGWCALGLVAAALSPTGFTYVFTAVLLCFAVLEAGLAVRPYRSRRRRPSLG